MNLIGIRALFAKNKKENLSKKERNSIGAEILKIKLFIEKKEK